MKTKPNDLMHSYPNSQGTYGNHRGLTKREYFAAMAMQGLISGCYAGNNVAFTVEGNCVAAVVYADALIEELNKEK